MYFFVNLILFIYKGIALPRMDTMGSVCNKLRSNFKKMLYGAQCMYRAQWIN